MCDKSHRYNFGNIVINFKKFIEKYRNLKDKKIGILTNHSFCDRNLINFADFLIENNFNVKIIFSPEHGFFGTEQMEEKVEDSFYKNVKVKSIYGDKLEPEDEDIKEIDVLIIAIPDNGSRYYTYKWSMMKMIEKCSEFGKKVIIFDYPNPLNGTEIEGPLIQKGYESFVGLYSIPVRFGLTIGELAIYLNKEFKIDAEIEVFRLFGWKRSYYFDDIDFPFIMMSPNMPDFETALLYPGMCLLEGTNISEGRGTTKPFKIFGAPFIEPFELLKKLKENVGAVSQPRVSKPEGVKFKPVYFKPMWNKYKGEICGGLEIYVTDKNRLKPFKMGLKIIKAIMDLYPDKFEFKKPPYEFEKEKMPFDILVGNSYIREMLEKEAEVPEIEKIWEKELKEFDEKRRKYFLY